MRYYITKIPQEYRLQHCYRIRKQCVACEVWISSGKVIMISPMLGS